MCIHVWLFTILIASLWEINDTAWVTWLQTRCCKFLSKAYVWRTAEAVTKRFTVACLLLLDQEWHLQLFSCLLPSFVKYDVLHQVWIAWTSSVNSECYATLCVVQCRIAHTRCQCWVGRSPGPAVLHGHESSLKPWMVGLSCIAVAAMSKWVRLRRRAEQFNLSLSLWWCWSYVSAAVMAYLIVHPSDMHNHKVAPDWKISVFASIVTLLQLQQILDMQKTAARWHITYTYIYCLEEQQAFHWVAIGWSWQGLLQSRKVCSCYTLTQTMTASKVNCSVPVNWHTKVAIWEATND